MKNTNTLARGLRNRNPLNIRHSSAQWIGRSKTQTDKAFVQFETMAYGYRAAFRILLSYYNYFKRQQQSFTIRNIISRWAPSNENNTEAYIKKVAAWSGIKADAMLPPPNSTSDIKDGFTGKDSIIKIASAMTRVECGIKPTDVPAGSIEDGWQLAFKQH